MIKDLNDVVNIITKDSYLKSVLDFESRNCFGYAYKKVYIYPKEERWKKDWYENQLVYFDSVEISVLDPRNIKIGVDVDRYVNGYISGEMLSKLIDPVTLSDCVNAIYKYKELFQVKESPDQVYSIRISGSKFPCIVVDYEQEKGVAYDVLVTCSEDFSLRYTRFESSPHFSPHLSKLGYETECGGLGYIPGEGYRTSCTYDEHDFLTTLKNMVKSFDIRTVLKKHETDVKTALDKFLNVIESNLE